MEKTPLAVQLGEFVARLRVEELPAAVVDKAKACVNHAVTVGMAGAATPRALSAHGAALRPAAPRPRPGGGGAGAAPCGGRARAARAGAAPAHGGVGARG